MEDARPRVVAAALALLSAFVLATCGAPGAPSRDEIIDSRDNLRPPITRPRALDRRPHGPRRRLPLRRPHALHAGRPRRTVARRRDGKRPPDGLTYTFHLRTDVTFHDGSPFTARTVIASWERALDPGNEERRRAVPVSDQGRARVQRRARPSLLPASPRANDSTLVVTLDEPLAIFIKMLAMPVAVGRPAEHPGQLRRAPDRHRPVEARRVEARRLPALREESAPTSAARPRPTRFAPASSPSRARRSPSSRAATSTCCRSRRPKRASGSKTRAASRCSCRRRRSSWCTSVSTPRAVRSPTRASARRSTTRST